MYKRYNSVYSVIDTEQEQHNYPLPLWGLTAVELWKKNNGNKYGKIEFYRFINYFSIEEFKNKFYNQFKIYIKTYPDGTIETFREIEYKQFINDCGDIIEMIENQNYYYWTTEKGFDFYLQQMKGWKKSFILEKKDILVHLINLKSLLYFITNATVEPEIKAEIQKTKKTLNPNFDDIDYQIEIIIKKTEQIFTSEKTQWKNLFSDDIKEFTKPIELKDKATIADLRLFLDSLKNNDLIKKRSFNKIIEESKAFIFDGNLITANNLKHATGGNYPNTANSNIIKETFKSLNIED